MANSSKFVRHVVVLVTLLLGSLCAHAVRIDFVPALQTKAVGDAVGIDVVVSGLNAASQIVSTFDLDVTYDPAC